MTLFNADDYGITPAQTEHILECRRRGRLTGVSAMPNSPYLEKAMDALAREPGLLAAVHLNLTEGLCLSDPRDVPLLADADGRFRCSFERLLFLSLGPSRRALSRQMEAEFTRQIRRVAPLLAGRGLRLDGHQHIQMIPAVARAACSALEALGLRAEYMRWSCEPLGPYLRHPGLWKEFRPVNLAKNLVLNTLAPFGAGTMARMGLRRNMVMGLVCSGDVNSRVVGAVLPDMERLAEKRGKTLELVMHPGWGVEPGESLDRPGGVFEAFALDPGRKREYDCLLEGQDTRP